MHCPTNGCFDRFFTKVTGFVRHSKDDSYTLLDKTQNYPPLPKHIDVPYSEDLSPAIIAEIKYVESVLGRPYCSPDILRNKKYQIDDRTFFIEKACHAIMIYRCLPSDLITEIEREKIIRVLKRGIANEKNMRTAILYMGKLSYKKRMAYEEEYQNLAETSQPLAA
ncbi:hypothetical protein QLL95_gp0725 [Cotonvirus japonicus]|uniref:Uncharacterized protein n=1 Tax=Cotonvirus japonicus TaxID=2811091 RepID=A0ABM7NT94_9VIRU|nr:hypothetical protein QLL95_gp0725 [Cotonvirus japonicus]BCS83398.1 hypothetical protein [Cotonvirus japonicus]